jgi:MFS family permease
MSERRSLAHDAEFLKLWIGETISDFGDQVTLLAIPLTAVIVLSASPFEMGLLAAAGTLPTALFSLPAGVWVDRLPRRPILIVADVGRALVLATIPIAFVLGVLGLPLLYAVAFAAGTLSVFFVVAYQSYLPALVGPAQLVDANGRMNASSSIAQMAGPSLAGVLVQVFTAPMPVVMDALSFVASAVGVGLIRRPEPAPVRRQRDMRAEIGEGMRALLGHGVLRAIVLAAAINVFCYSAGLAIFLLYLSREVGLEPAVIGLLLGIGSVGALLGALFAGRLARRIGVGPAFVLAATLLVAGQATRVAVVAPREAAIASLAAAQFASLVGFAIANVLGPAIRQALTPPALLGRVNASYRFLVWGTGPLGALFGGTLAQVIGLRPALFIAGCATTIALVLVLRSPLAGLRSLEPRPAA